MNLDVSARNPVDRSTRLYLIGLRAKGMLSDVRDELERTDPDDNQRCLLLSNFADDIESFIFELERLREARQL